MAVINKVMVICREKKIIIEFEFNLNWVSLDSCGEINLHVCRPDESHRGSCILIEKIKILKLAKLTSKLGTHPSLKWY